MDLVVVLKPSKLLYLKTEAVERAEVEVARGSSRTDSRNSMKRWSLLRTGWAATRLMNRSRAYLLLAVNSVLELASPPDEGLPPALAPE